MPRPVLEDCLTLDAYHLAAQGTFKPQAQGNMTTGNAGGPSLRWAACGDGRGIWGLSVAYATTAPDGSSAIVSYIVPVLWAAGTRGGTFPLLACPGHECRPECEDQEHCTRRSRKLYLPPGATRFACRTCVRLPYRSQVLNPNAYRGAYWRWDQVTRRAGRVGKRGPGEVAKLRLINRWEAARAHCEAILGRDFERLDGRAARIRARRPSSA